MINHSNPSQITENPAVLIIKAENDDIDLVNMLNQSNNARPYSKNILLDMFKNGSIITLVKYDNTTIGYIITELTYEVGEIISIVVDKKYRNQGIGQKVLQKSLSHLYELGAKRVLLEVEEINLSAIALYKKSGFNQISIRKNYYGENSALIMQHTFRS